MWHVQQETIRQLEQIVREEDGRLAKLRVKLTETEQENGRLASEREVLRKDLEEALEIVGIKEKECARLAQERSSLEKRIKQFQAAQDAASQSKSVTDHEMAKIKVTYRAIFFKVMLLMKYFYYNFRRRITNSFPVSKH